ncbi:MAG: GTPase ObgE [Desulfosudaceae bacterium]
MNFIDEATITVASGKGGPGCVSFRRERFIPRGGPDGGDGGKGGDLIFQVDPGLRTLHHFKAKRRFFAENGRPGEGKQKTGKSGRDLVVFLPPGTIISDAETGTVLRDMVVPEEPFRFLAGGRGGKGNRHFTSSTHRSPRFAQPGEPGRETVVRLELKLLADVGIIGLPNAGKSTLLRVLSAARPAVGDYPFTTLSPHLGMVFLGDSEPIAVADIPGLIEGAHQGSGLGIKFLKHIERTRLLVHLLDAAAIEEDDPLAAFGVVNNELARYSTKLAKMPQVVVLNKMDVPDARLRAEAFLSAVPEKKCFCISAAANQEVEALKKYLFAVLSQQSRGGGD